MNRIYRYGPCPLHTSYEPLQRELKEKDQVVKESGGFERYDLISIYDNFKSSGQLDRKIGGFVAE